MVQRQDRGSGAAAPGVRPGLWLLALLLPLLVSAGHAADLATPDGWRFESAPPPRRVALVIGNGAYRHAVALPNPASDARAVAAALTRLGFTVVEGIDLGREAMVQRLRAFGQAAESADVALVFYAGHGLQVGGRNYLLPVDAQLEREQDLRYEAVALETMLDEAQPARRLRIVILDACRDNPFAARLARSLGRTRSASIGRGLAQVADVASDTLIAYATAADAVAEDGLRGTGHSPYTAALLRQLEQPGLEINLLFGRVRDSVVKATAGRQRPFTYGSLGGEPFYFVAPPEASPTGAADAQAVELTFWRSIEASRDPGDFAEYLRTWPEGAFAGLARNRLRSLAAAAPPPLPAAPAAPAPAPGPDRAAALDARLAALPCAAVGVRVTADRVAVAGDALPGSALEAALRDAAGLTRGGRVERSIRPLTRGDCPVIEPLLPLLRRNRARDAPLSVAPARPTLSVGEALQLDIRAPTDPAPVLTIDLYGADGRVHHLADPPDGGRRRPLDGPAGRRLVVVIASAAPLGLDGRPPVEEAATYRRALLPALQALTARRDDTAVAAVAAIELRAAAPAAAAPPVSPSAAARPPRPASPRPARCGAILERAQLGEVLSDADRAFLHQSCS